jgi:hypothetical protein
LFNALNVSPVYAVRSLNFGTMAHLQPSSILVVRVFQLGAIGGSDGVVRCYGESVGRGHIPVTTTSLFAAP